MAGAPEITIRLELGSASGRVRIDAATASASREIPLPVGTTGLFRNDPPRESEIEFAIERVEQAVMPLAKLLPHDAVLCAGDAFVRHLGETAAGSDNVDAVSVVAVEALFEQLAMAARRGLWSSDQCMDSRTAAGVLILREFMHHLGFDRIALPPAAKGR
jgi:hypothetical protein